MKKLLLLLFAAMVCGATLAQTNGVAYDKVDLNGARTIVSESIGCASKFTDNHPLCYAVGRFSLEDKCSWYLAVEMNDLSSFSLPKGSVLLLKLSDESIIELHQSLPSNDTSDMIGKYDRSTGMTSYVNRGSYDITEDQIKAIAVKGVIKTRIETQIGTFDSEFKKNKVGEAIANGYIAVSAAASQNNNIRSGF